MRFSENWLRTFVNPTLASRALADALTMSGLEVETVEPVAPTDKAGRLEALYHLIYMIYLDKVVEDIELEVATAYAEKLGLQKELVGDLFKSIATLGSDNSTVRDVRKEVEDFLKLQNS